MRRELRRGRLGVPYGQSDHSSSLERPARRWGSGDRRRGEVLFSPTSLPVRLYSPKYILAWITRENINPLLEQNGFNGPVDLLSLDVDGVDYWLRDALEGVSPRVVILEYADVLAADRACTVAYQDDFRANPDPETGTPHGFLWRFAPGIR